jgi:DNA-binding Lrp family transcriptional regulator
MASLNYDVIAERLTEKDNRLRLIQYIFKVQGATFARLDYRAAAEALDLSYKTISRYCDELAELGIIQFFTNSDGKGTLKLTDEILN